MPFPVFLRPDAPPSTAGYAAELASRPMHEPASAMPARHRGRADHRDGPGRQPPPGRSRL